jgi:hypothetical protein
VGLLLVFTGMGLFLDGLAGGVAGVVVGAVLLARLPTRVIGGIGVACLVAAPVAVAVDGVPSAAEIAPAIVGRSLWPHHLTFVGLALVAAWVAIDVVGPLRRQRESGPHRAVGAEEGPEPGLAAAPLGVRWVIVAVVALGALAASVAVVLA